MHLLSLKTVSTADVETISKHSADLKAKFAKGIREPLLPGRVLALLFEKQSLRTRVSFEAGISHLGGTSIMLGEDVGFGSRESMSDFSRVLSGMVDVIVARAKHHATVESLAKYSTCPVINGLTDESHPCQALADLFTLQEHFGKVRGKTLTWIGDGNNVAVSLARACHRLGMRFVVCTPVGYELDPTIGQELVDASEGNNCEGFELIETTDPRLAVKEADAIYTDVWASMGQESEREKRKQDLADYQVNAKLMALAPSSAVFMHCLPARRGEEVTDDVIDSDQSIIVEQAINRMHAQKGILAWLLC